MEMVTETGFSGTHPKGVALHSAAYPLGHHGGDVEGRVGHQDHELIAAKPGKNVCARINAFTLRVKLWRS
jgi:hypothetical protein